MFGFPKVERTENQYFNNNFLRQVIWQIKFLPNESVTSNWESISLKFKNSLPNLRRGGAFEFFFQPGSPVIQPVEAANPPFSLLSEDGQKVLAFETDTINYTVQGTSYRNFEQLSKEIQAIYDVLSDCNIQVITRMAIRKINIIEFAYGPNDTNSAVDINSFILIPPVKPDFSIFPNRHLIQQTIQSVNYLSTEGSLNLRYGLIVPQKEGKNGEFVIDIDLFKEQEIPTIRLKEYFSLINEEIYNVFFWLLSPATKSTLQS